MCSGNAAPITEAIKREGIPDTYPVIIKIIGATIKVLATQRIRTITTIYDDGRILLRIRIHVRKRKFEINRGELWDD